MSKEAAMRAMREARYNERAAGATARSSAAATAASTQARPAVRPAKAEEPRAVAPTAASDALCGHRSMNGRTCTREQGHAAKSHRYS